MPETPITFDTLEHQIAHEERIVGLPTDRPLTHAAIIRRHAQIGVLLGLLSLAVVATLVTSLPALRLFSCAAALAFGVYAWIEGQHLERLARLQRDESSINLTVADSLLRSGILCADRTVLVLGGGGVWLDPAAAHDALARHEPIRRGARDGRTVIAVPLEHQGEVVGVLEVVSVETDRYSLVDELLVTAYARGAVAALLSGSRRVNAS